MSAINALAGSGAPAATGSRFNELSSEEFIKIIFTELQNQDPFKPNDSGALLEQLNSIRSIESDIEMSNRLGAGVVWLNTFNRFDASAPFGGYRESGFGREGGRQGLSAYVKFGGAR